MNEETTNLPAEAVTTGVQAADAAPQTPDPAPREPGPEPQVPFEDLIRGPYKAQYEARLQEVLRKRLKNSKAAADRWETLAPTLELLAGKYGIADANDAQALAGAIRAEHGFPSAEAEGGGEAEAVRRLRTLERENARLRRQILPAAMAYAARKTEQRLTSHIAAGNARPSENGMAGQGAVLVGGDVSRLSRAQRQEIIRRVQAGERIAF